MFKRIFLIVLDSVGIGALPDADKYGDEGANTLRHTIKDHYNLDVLEMLGLTKLIGYDHEKTRGLYMRCKTMNKMKDSLNGHYEMMGAINKIKFETYPEGFPLELISKIQHLIGKEVIGNVACDGEKILDDLGEMHIKSGCPIIYTSNDSVLQLACHEDVISVEELYDMCEKIAELVTCEPYRINRVIARPFTGKLGEFKRTSKRKDFSIDPPINVLDLLDKNQIQTIAIGKIGDIFNYKSISSTIKTNDNIDTMMKVIDFAKGNFNGLLFANFNDFDTMYGHRRDREGYLKALEEFNYYLPILLKNLKKDDLLIITADHGCDPTNKGTDHTREYVPILMYNPLFKKGKMLDDRESLADIGATILDNYRIKNEIGIGKSIFDELR